MKRNGYSQQEDKAIKEWLRPFASFVNGKVVDWGTTNITQYRHLKEDASIDVVLDSEWEKLIDIAAVVRKADDEEGV
jgi:hypothetical protein